MSVRLPIILLLTASVTVCQSAPVDLTSLRDIHGGHYKLAPYIKTAAALQKMGREAACNALLRAVETGGENSPQTFILCRMLFTKRATGDFRDPRLGFAHFLGDTDYVDWPLEPIELVDGVPFLITNGYRLGGRAEAASGYLRYCMANCDWSTVRYSEISNASPAASLTKLYASPKWKRPLGSYERDFLSAQIE